MKMLHPNCRRFFPAWARYPRMPMQCNLPNTQQAVMQQIGSSSGGVAYDRRKNGLTSASPDCSGSRCYDNYCLPASTETFLYCCKHKMISTYHCEYSLSSYGIWLSVDLNCLPPYLQSRYSKASGKLQKVFFSPFLKLCLSFLPFMLHLLTAFGSEKCQQLIWPVVLLHKSGMSSLEW